MVMEDNYGNEYDEFEDDEPTQTSPRWRTLSPKERKLLMKNVFSNPEWYDNSQGSPVFEGGTSNPMFEEIAEKADAPVKEVRRYYAAWLKSQGFTPADLRTQEQPAEQATSSAYHQSPSQAATTPPMASGPMSGGMSGMPGGPPSLPTVAPPPDDGGNEMWAMMQFLTQQQYMQMQQQQFQMQMMMEQRRLDQQKEGDTRREAMARDQQFMNQQMSFMRDITKKSGDDGFFDSEMKGIFKERMVDSMFGEKDEGWKDSIKDVLGSDTLKAAVGGLGGALSAATAPKVNIPAGYDNPEYNPYAQASMVQTQAPQPPQPLPMVAPGAVEQAQPLPDGVFFSDEAPPQIVAPPQQPTPTPTPTQFNDDEYKKILVSAFVEAMGPVANDPQVLSALQEQVDVSVATTMIEMPDALPQIKLQAMNEKLLLIRNLRDIGMGMMDLRERTPPGTVPSDLVVGAVVGELRKNPEFYKIFAENTYDELMAKISPFKTTGAVEKDYAYLLKPEVQEVCRPLLQAVKNDALQNGAPQMPGLA
jgi:hypothetical protein